MCDDPIGVGSQVVLLLLYLRVVFAPFFIYRNQYETGKRHQIGINNKLSFKAVYMVKAQFMQNKLHHAVPVHVLACV